ncbi:unnamed protein product [Polarella glacialis]|uniref:Uncharacterized protein n=1 Tax=Polarella glacialis TaxID=89957 RepID=A0A813IUY0_POLGL|nr:unnamed protein product [Polarella glacialis]
MWLALASLSALAVPAAFRPSAPPSLQPARRDAALGFQLPPLRVRAWVNFAGGVGIRRRPRNNFLRGSCSARAALGSAGVSGSVGVNGQRVALHEAQAYLSASIVRDQASSPRQEVLGTTLFEIEGWVVSRRKVSSRQGVSEGPLSDRPASGKRAYLSLVDGNGAMLKGELRGDSGESGGLNEQQMAMMEAYIALAQPGARLRVVWLTSTGVGRTSRPSSWCSASCCCPHRLTCTGLWPCSLLRGMARWTRRKWPLPSCCPEGRSTSRSYASSVAAPSVESLGI